MPNFAVSTICFGPDADACEVLDFAVEHGFQGIELSSYHFWPERLGADDVERMRSAIKQRGMRLAIHARHRGISFGAHDPVLRQRCVEELQATVRFAAELGGDVVVAHVGDIVPAGNNPHAAEQTLRQEAFQFALDSFARCAPVAAECGVRICVENVQLRPSEVLTSFADHLRLVDAIAHAAVVCALDTGHAHVNGGIQACIQAFGPRLQHIHLHDNHGDKDEHLEVGKGAIRFAEFSHFFQQFRGLISLETRNPTDPHGAVLRSRDDIESLWRP
ncbi:MAG TPA: sugar phosphate isomerase/epimerase family protein [Candidatus Tectomicrobia bacterium]|nr:sugar phosphate isomerase/epimerase family protein [Candidatus Tectomicrobia bacterium]